MTEETLELIKEALDKHGRVAIYTPTQQIFDSVLKSISENLKEIKDPLRIQTKWSVYNKEACVEVSRGTTFHSPLYYYKEYEYPIIYLNTPKCLKRI